MLFLSIIAAAHAGPASGGIQVALYGPGAELAEGLIEAQVFDIDKPLVTGEAACYDQVGVRDLNVHIPVGDAEIELAQDMVVVDISFEEIHGEDMVIFGEDEDWADLCPSFETDFHSFQITDARFRVVLSPWVDGETVSMDVVGEPLVTGEITTDIDWVPDTLILTFVEDKIWEVLEEKVKEDVPALVSEYLDTSLYMGQIGDLDVAVDLSDVRIDANALVVGMDLSAEWEGESCLVTNAPEEPEGRTPQIDFGGGDGSSLGVGLTEHQLNGLLLSAYADGLLCFDFGPLAGALDAVGETIGDPVQDAEAEVEFNAPPVMRMDEDRLRLRLDDFHFALRGTVKGEDTVFLSLDADIEAAVELRVDHEVSSIVMDLVYVDLQIADFQADSLLSDQEGAEERLFDFLQTWVMDVVASRIRDVPLYGNLFHAMDYYLRLDAADAVNGGILMRATIFEGDDRAVDTMAPDTQARISQADSSQMTLVWRGEDDKADALTYSWRIDKGEWSGWIGGDHTVLDTPEAGAHILEVRARDDWHNVDPTPAVIAFETRAPAEADKGCMCSTSGTRSALLAWLMVPMLWVRRRR